MNLDKEKVSQQLKFLEDEIRNLESKKDIDIEVYLSSKETQYFVERAFQRAIEACINIGNHVISRKELGSPGSFSDVFKILGREGVIPLELSETFIYIARFRNKLVHLYWKIDPKEVFKYLQNNISDLEAFYKIAKKFI